MNNKDKVKTLEVSAETEKKILAMMLSDETFLKSFKGLIEPECFDYQVLGDMSEIILGFFEKYSRTPTDEELIEELDAFISKAKKRKKDFPEGEYLRTAEEILAIGREDDFSYARDKAVAFFKHQAVKKALVEGLKKLEKNDYEGIALSIQEAVRLGRNTHKLVKKDLSSVSERIEFLDEDKDGTGRFIKGGLTLIGGKGGVGKGAFTEGGLGASVTVGKTFMGTKLKKGIFFLLDEEDLKPTVKNRMENNEGNLENFDWMELEKDNEGYAPIFSLKDHIPVLRDRLRQYPTELLTDSILVVDSLGTFMGMKKGTDSYNDVDVRKVLMPLSKLAEEFNMAVIVIAHFNKKKTSDLVDMILGSVAFTNICRAVYAIIADEEDSDRHYLLPLKWNDPHVKDDGIEFRIEEKADKITFVKSISADDVRDLKAEREPGQPRSLGPGESARLFIKRETIRHGEQRPIDLEKKAKKEGICGRTTLHTTATKMVRRGELERGYDAHERPVWRYMGNPTDDKVTKATEVEADAEKKEEESPKVKEIKKRVERIRAKHEKQS